MSPLRLACVVLVLAACSSSQSFVSTWTAEDATPFDFDGGSKVVAAVIMQEQVSRRAAEDTLAREITDLGAFGIPMYKLVPDAIPKNEPKTRAALEKAGVQGVVVMRPTSIDAKLAGERPEPADHRYSQFWVYYQDGWSEPWVAPPRPDVSDEEPRINRTVSVETVVYSLRQDKLVWSGQSRTTNPESVQQLVTQLAEATAQELHKHGLL